MTTIKASDCRHWTHRADTVPAAGRDVLRTRHRGVSFGWQPSLPFIVRRKGLEGWKTALRLLQ